MFKYSKFDERFETEDESRKIYFDLPPIDIDKYVVIPYSKIIKIEEIYDCLSSILPKTIYCNIYQRGIVPIISVRYYYRNGNNLFKEVPIILKNNRLYILKPLVDTTYTSEINDKYQQFVNKF